MSPAQSPAAQSSDTIVRSTVVRAPRSRVWSALTDPQKFNQWFGVNLSDPFLPGKRVTGPVTMKGYEHLTMDITIDKVEPERLFSWRWHPGGDADIDPNEPMTLVVFELEETKEGTRVTVTETGFDKIPAARRSKAFRENTQGWDEQMVALAKYVHGNR